MTLPPPEWHKSSPERRIHRQLAAGDVDKRGWIVYRTAYKPELDAVWATLKRLVLGSLRKGAEESDAPEIANQMDQVFVAGPGLEGVSLDELKRRFQSWARADAAHVLDAYEPGTSRGSRSDFFVQADEDALRSFQPDSGSTSDRLLFRKWIDPAP